MLAGTVFSLGLILVVVGGAELFTGNNLIVMAWAGERVSTVALLRNWTIAYAGNFLGALAVALAVYGAGTHNILVCLAVWLSYSARTTTDRILAVVPPIAAFVAAGFEHSVANMYFVPLGLLIAAGDPTLLTARGLDAQALTRTASLGRNLVPVTLGNVIGGTVLVGIVYWFVYLRSRKTP